MRRRVITQKNFDHMTAHDCIDVPRWVYDDPQRRIDAAPLEWAPLIGFRAKRGVFD